MTTSKKRFTTCCRLISALLTASLALLVTSVAGIGRPALAAPSKKTTADAVPRKLVTKYHMKCVEKKHEDRYYDEWVTATYDKQGRITHKEIKRETSKEFGGWNGELTYALDFEYDADGRLAEVSGNEDGWSAAMEGHPVEWKIEYAKDGTTSRADGTELAESRHVYDEHDRDGNLVTRDYLIRAGQAVDAGILSFSYDKEGRVVGQAVESVKAGGGTDVEKLPKTHYDASVAYGEGNRIASIEMRDTDDKLLSRYAYEYDGEGRVTRRVQHHNGGSEQSQTYSYDKKGRLASVDDGARRATFTTDEDGSIVSARIESDYDVQTYEVEYATRKTLQGQEPFNAVDLTDPTMPELYGELWVSHASIEPTPFGESEFLRENRRWLELHRDTPNGGSSHDVASSPKSDQYESVLKAYREGLASDDQPPYEAVNPEAWIARAHTKEELAYALCDLNGDGSVELLIGVEEEEPTLNEGLSVWYRLYDLFTIVDGEPTRVLGDEGMTSLGHRAYCVPCEDGALATGGSGGATYYVCEYWQMGKKANDLKLISRVVADGGFYTFEDGDGKTETLRGEVATNRFAEVVASHTPIARFDWHPLYASEDA